MGKDEQFMAMGGGCCCVLIGAIISIAVVLNSPEKYIDDLVANNTNIKIELQSIKLMNDPGDSAGIGALWGDGDEISASICCGTNCRHIPDGKTHLEFGNAGQTHTFDTWFTDSPYTIECDMDEVLNYGNGVAFNIFLTEHDGGFYGSDDPAYASVKTAELIVEENGAKFDVVVVNMEGAGGYSKVLPSWFTVCPWQIFPQVSGSASSGMKLLSTSIKVAENLNTAGVNLMRAEAFDEQFGGMLGEDLYPDQLEGFGQWITDITGLFCLDIGGGSQASTVSQYSNYQFRFKVSQALQVKFALLINAMILSSLLY